jgi:phosphoribosyl 1,2-cyclic phosphodiesterase
VALIGSGNSTAVPWLRCVVNPASSCAVCAGCVADPTSRNVRNNPAAVMTVAHPDGTPRNILIDVGKTFRDSVRRCFPALGVSKLDAVFITHAHADAFLGLDDLRDVESRTGRLPVYLTAGCFEVVSRAFAYLVHKPATPGLFLAQLDFIIVEPFVPFRVAGLLVVPIPVEHGPPGPMLGFEFCYVEGEEEEGGHHHAPAAAAAAPVPAAVAAPPPAGARVVYISDIAALPADSRAYLRDRPIDLLVLDALSYASYPTHFSMAQAVACARDVGAERTVFVGMNHRVDFYAEQPKLQAFGAARGRALELGFDGWTESFDLRAVGSLGGLGARVDAARTRAPLLPPPAGGAVTVAGAGGGGGCAIPVVAYTYKDVPGMEEWAEGCSPSASAGHARAGR